MSIAARSRSGGHTRVGRGRSAIDIQTRPLTPSWRGSGGGSPEGRRRLPALRGPRWGVTRRLREGSAASVAMADATAPHQPGIAAIANQPMRTDARQRMLCDSTAMVVCSPIRPADNPMAWVRH
jgi:hypothetical protein